MKKSGHAGTWSGVFFFEKKKNKGMAVVIRYKESMDRWSEKG